MRGLRITPRGWYALAILAGLILGFATAGWILI